MAAGEGGGGGELLRLVRGVAREAAPGGRARDLVGLVAGRPGHGLAGHGLLGQPGDVSVQLFQGSVADVSLFCTFGVVAALVCRHLHLSLDTGTARVGLLYPTVGDAG